MTRNLLKILQKNDWKAQDHKAFTFLDPVGFIRVYLNSFLSFKWINII